MPLRVTSTPVLPASLAAAAILSAGPVRAEALPAKAAPAPEGRAISLSGEYIIDAVAVARGPSKGLRYVDLATLTAEVDLDTAAGWRGGQLVAEAIATTGQTPNDLAGTLQGINNSEVPRNRAKLYQFYLAQSLADGALTLRAGFIDLNAEFYSNDAAALLIAPAFGIGSELAATGPNGPAIFPSTAPTVAVRIAPTPDTYASFAVVNAEAGVLGDAGGMAPLLRQGALLIGEAGWTGGDAKLALGSWVYTRRQDDIRLIGDDGNPLRQRARGGYVLVEWGMGARIDPEPDAPHAASLFLRAGLSDGDTTPYRGGWQAGILVNRPLAMRPGSLLSFGLNQAFLSNKYRLNESEAGNPQRAAETGFEVTYADAVADWLTVQADAQYVRNPGRAPGTRDAVIFGLRFTFAFSQQF